MNQRRKILATAAASIAGMLVCSMSYAQANLPKGPITLVVPFASGGATDIVSRLVAKKVTDKTGVSIVVDNVAGGGGVVGDLGGGTVLGQFAHQGVDAELNAFGLEDGWVWPECNCGSCY